MNFSVPTKDKSRIFAALGKANKAFQEIYPGDRPDRQPVHTVYGGADLFSADTAQKMANAALKTLLENASDHIEFARALGQPIKVAPDAIEPVPSSAFITAAKRPGNSRMNTRKLRDTFGLALPSWQSGTDRMLTEVLSAHLN